MPKEEEESRASEEYWKWKMEQEKTKKANTATCQKGCLIIFAAGAALFVLIFLISTFAS